MRKPVQISIACGNMGNQYVALCDDGSMWWLNGAWEQLPPIPQPAPEPAPPCDCCPVCGGDCGSANPPVTHCPMRPTPTPAKVAPVPVTEEMRKAAYLEAVTALDDGVPDNLYWDRILTAALAAAPPDPLREAVERYATQLTEQPSSVAHAIAHGLRAILETGRG